MTKLTIVSRIGTATYLHKAVVTKEKIIQSYFVLLSKAYEKSVKSLFPLSSFLSSYHSNPSTSLNSTLWDMDFLAGIGCLRGGMRKAVVFISYS